MTLHCFDCGSKLKHFETVITDVLTTNGITLSKKTKFIRISERCGFETNETIPESVLVEIQTELTRIDELTPDPEPEPVEPVEVVTLAMIYAKLKEIEANMKVKI